jgi:hypothetical protein
MKIIFLATIVLSFVSSFSARAAISCSESQKKSVCDAFYTSSPPCNMKKDHKCTCENDGGGPSVGAGTYCRTAGGIMKTGDKPSKVESRSSNL